MAERREAGAPADELVPAILHVDMDAFFAAVEILDDPALAGRPVVVGGTGRRGVVASCSYEARAFGVRSAMPMARARQLCPTAVVIAGRYERYVEMSGRLRRLLLAITPLVEPIGLDEAFLDVTGARRLLGPAAKIAHSLRAMVAAELDLTCSIGVGRSKLIAKLASRAAKPNARRSSPQPGPGVVIVGPEGELGFLHPLPVEALWGVGPATARRLHELGLPAVGDLARVPERVLVSRFGEAQGRQLAQLAAARDDSPVEPDRPTKSVSHEETFGRDLHLEADLARHTARMAEAVAEHLRTSGLAARTVTVKVRFGDFSTLTRSHTLPFAVDTAAALGAVASALAESVDPSAGVRLLGVSASGLQAAGRAQQLSFDLGSSSASAAEPPGTGAPAVELQASWRELAAAIDAIRRRFGVDAVGAAVFLGDEGLALPRRHGAQWGPTREG